MILLKVTVLPLKLGCWSAKKSPITRVPDNEHQARDHYREAFEADPKNPFHLASYVEYEIYCGEPLGFRAVMRPVFNLIYAQAGIPNAGRARLMSCRVE
jgi:hypothetical protein